MQTEEPDHEFRRTREHESGAATGTAAEQTEAGPSIPSAWLPPEVDERTSDDDAPPVELWRAVGDVTPWGTMLVLLGWALIFALTVWRRELDVVDVLVMRGANVAPGGAADAIWRSIASTFLHASASHVFFNAITLLVLGQAAERVFTRGGFPFIAVSGGALASFGSLAWRSYVSPDAPGISIGGSGLVFAIGGSLLIAAIRLRRRLAVGRARAFGAVILLLTMPGLASGFERFGTDNAAHAAGLIAGFALGAFVPLRAPLGGSTRSTSTVVLGGLAGIAMAASFLLVLRGKGFPQP